MKYQVQLDIYEGPLDLLVRSVTNQEIPAYEISVCTIIDQFIEYFMGMGTAVSDLEEGSRFLVLAATLGGQGEAAAAAVKRKMRKVTLYWMRKMRKVFWKQI